MRTRSVARTAALSLAMAAATALLATACSSATAVGNTGSGGIQAIGAENEYANVIQQIGGKYVQVTAIMSNPNTDPHTFEASPAVAREISNAGLIVQNGVGYDTWATDIEKAVPAGSRKIVDVQQLLGLPDSTPNPHLWYNPATMPKVATAIANDLAAIQPAHASYFKANAATFTQSLSKWTQALDAFKAKHPNTPVATTEPVADYMLQAAGADNMTPWAFQADIMNGTDPTPQDISLEKSLFGKHLVNVFAYNQQVVDALTTSIRQNAEKNRVPVVGVYEIMPAKGYDYQSWMLAETQAIQKAITKGVSTEQL